MSHYSNGNPNMGSYHSNDLDTYNPHIRLEEMKIRLNSETQKAKANILKKVNGSTPKASKSNANDCKKGDMLKMQIDDIRGDVGILRERSNKYVAPHFTRFLREIIAEGSRIQMELDRLDSNGKDDIRQEKKNLIQEIDQILKNVICEAHQNACPACEVPSI